MKELSSEDEEEEEKDDDGELQGLLIKKKRRNKSMRETERERLLMMRSFQLTINATNKQNNIRSESSQLPSFSHQRRPLPFTTTTKGTCSTISYRSVQPSETLLKAPRATQKNKQTNLTPHTIATSVA
jgi:hypothetical protein